MDGIVFTHNKHYHNKIYKWKHIGTTVDLEWNPLTQKLSCGNPPQEFDPATSGITNVLDPQHILDVTGIYEFNILEQHTLICSKKRPDRVYGNNLAIVKKNIQDALGPTLLDGTQQTFFDLWINIIQNIMTYTPNFPTVNILHLPNYPDVNTKYNIITLFQLDHVPEHFSQLQPLLHPISKIIGITTNFPHIQQTLENYGLVCRYQRPIDLSLFAPDTELKLLQTHTIYEFSKPNVSWLKCKETQPLPAHSPPPNIIFLDTTHSWEPKKLSKPKSYSNKYIFTTQHQTQPFTIDQLNLFPHNHPLVQQALLRLNHKYIF
ncbi:hypothetical protein K7432_016061 [Basidiobolus ranarum]|uniref:Uncharacterized protein n=1 Tax=Basidiobolus ranarum TaxID=34480 RepID=A0ABR2VMW1_9FUNG